MPMGTQILTQQLTSPWQISYFFANTMIFVKMRRMLPRGEPEHVDVAEPKEGKQGNDVPPLHPDLAEP